MRVHRPDTTAPGRIFRGRRRGAESGLVSTVAAVCVLSSGCEPTEQYSGNKYQEKSEQLQQCLRDAKGLLEARRFPAAAAAATACLALDSTSADLNNVLASAEASQGRYQAATQALERALRHEPDLAIAHLNLGAIYTKLGRFDRAEATLKRALELKPEWASVHRRLAELYLATERPKAAVAAVREASRLFPGDATHTFFLGRALEAVGEPGAALEAYREAADLDIGFEESLYRLSVLARRRALHALADSALARFLRLQGIGGGGEASRLMRKLRSSILDVPGNPTHHLALGEFFARHGYWDEALNKFRRAARLAPSDARLLHQIGNRLSESSRYGDAAAFYERAIGADSSFVPALVNMGSVLDLTNRQAEALTYYRRALAEAPSNASVHFVYGSSLQKAGRTDEALSALTEGRALAAPDSRLRRQFDEALASARAGKRGVAGESQQ